MTSKRGFYGFLALSMTGLLAAAASGMVRAQETLSSDQSPPEAALADPAAVQVQQVQIEADAAAETGLIPAPAEALAAPAVPENPVPGTALPETPAVQAQQALGQTTESIVQNPVMAQDERPVVPLAGPGDSPAAQAAARDALPLSRLQIRTEGFDLAGDRNIMVYPGDDPSKMVDQQALQAEIRQEAFDAATTGLFPLSPEHIQELLRQYDATERAAQSPPYDLPKAEVVVQTISMDPGVPPPVIKTAVGHVTTINMLDITGAPWPVQDITWAGDFEIVEPEEGGHIIRITPMGKFTYGNMAVRMLTLKTPITFSLRVERESVHYRVDARIPEYGPFAQAQLMEGATQLAAGNTTLSSVLDGVPPTGAVRLAVAGADGRTTAYKVGATTYVRTPLTLLSPGWQSSVSSADGMNVYALEDTPVLLLSDKGNFLRAKLSEDKDLFDDR